VSAGSPEPAASARSIKENGGVAWGPLLLYEQIGHGAFGAVFRAWDPALDHEVALKRYELPRHAGPLASEVIREGQLLARVKHPNVVTVHGAGRVGDEVGVWMDFVRGRTLERVVRDEGPMSAPEAIVIGDCLCRALAAVHAAGLLHRDIKASNVMREAGGRLVLLDFGTVIEFSAENLADTVAGTPLYVAPEVFTGQPASACSDIYGLGVLLFFLVTGTYPVTGRSIEEIQLAHSTGRRRLLADLRPDLPSAFVRVVERATAPRPDDRYRSAGALLADLTATIGSRVDRTHDWGSVVAAVGGAAAAIWVLGLLTSVAFNLTLGRTGRFADDTFLWYWIWGFRALVGPAVFMAIAAAVGVTVAACVPARFSWKARLSRFDRSRLAWGVLFSQWVVAAVLFWRFRDFLSALTSTVALASPDVFVAFDPDDSTERQLYAMAVSVTILASSCAWWFLLRSAPSRRAIGKGVVTTGVVTTALFLVLAVIPYRLVWHNEFELIQFDGDRCYAIGGSAADWLLYCPTAPPPRTRIAAATDSRITRTGTVQSIFPAKSPTSK
jgi:hypothetical protein